jgi:MoaA/NifB/PqqE/SkfB family radical SAM enzyme
VNRKTIKTRRRGAQVVAGPAAKIIRGLLLLTLFRLAVGAYHSLRTGWRSLNKLKRKRQTLFGDQKISKFVRSGFKFHMALNAPAWPSKSFNLAMTEELNRVQPFKQDQKHLRSLIFGITTRCPLTCSHCYAADVLGNAEELSIEDLQTVLQRFTSRGLAQVQFSGGEPLSRFDDLLTLTQQAYPRTENWLLTSGMKLSSEKALALKKAGMTGINVSLDHWEPEKHNTFRENEDSFSWALRAVSNAVNHGLLVCVTLCATPEFVSSENLWSYINLARDIGASFVQILEARSIGRLAGKDVRLSDAQLGVLDEFFCSLNSPKKHRDMPILIYHGYRQRRFGCYGGGDEFLYVDPLGWIHPCPFSEVTLGNALTDDLDPVLQEVDCDRSCDRYHLVRNKNTEQSIRRTT